MSSPSARLRTPAPYSLGMTEETDQRDGPTQDVTTRVRRTAVWLDAMQDKLMALMDLAVIELEDPDTKGDKLIALDRRVRAIGNLARAAKQVAALTDARHIPEDEMSDDSDSEDPAEIQRLRAELESRFEHLRGVYERKRRDAGLEPEDASTTFGLGVPPA